MRFLIKFLRERVTLSEAVTLPLIYLSMYAVLLAVELVVRGTSVEILRPLVFWGVVAGWLMGRASFKLWQFVSISLLSGFLFTMIYVSGINAALGAIVRSSVIYLFRWIFSRISDTSDLLFQLTAIQTRIRAVFEALSIWMNDLLSLFAVYNQISTLISWGFLMWIFSGWFAWTTIGKKRPIWGVLPAGTMLALLMTYTLEKRFTLILLLGAGLILVGIANYDQKRKVWKEQGVKGADDGRIRLYLVVIGISLAAMVFADITPSVRIKPIADTYRRLVYGPDEESEQIPAGTVVGGGFSPDLYSVQRFSGLPRQMLIGSGPELDQEVVMIVSFPAESLAGSALPRAARYWKAYSFDQYTGAGWESSSMIRVSYQPGQEIFSIFSGSFDILTQEIRLANSIQGTLYSAGPPITLDHEVQVFWRTLVEEDYNGESQIIGSADLFAVEIDSPFYQVRSLVSNASDEELRTGEGEYPPWVRERYLQLPETVPDRVRALAREIVANQPTSYDQAKAIESFLRAYPYTLDLPDPPQDRDVVDYFLFELQTGYCDYYATSMVVLARSIGLPARVVIGYAGGQYQLENEHFLVTEADAHSWVEVYFREYGWIPFEPTAARSQIDDRELALPLPPELESLPEVPEPETKRDFPWWQVGLGSFLLGALALWVGDRVDLARLRRLDPNSMILAVYLRVFRYARWMRIGHRKSDTLYEFSDLLKRELKTIQVDFRSSNWTGDITSQIDRLTKYAVEANYRGAQLPTQTKREIIWNWRALRSSLRTAILIKFWQTWLERVLGGNERVDGLESIRDGAVDGTR